MSAERGSSPPGSPPREDEEAEARASDRPRSGPPAPVGTWTNEISSADSDRPTDVDVVSDRDADRTLPFGGPDLPKAGKRPGGVPPPMPVPATGIASGRSKAPGVSADGSGAPAAEPSAVDPVDEELDTLTNDIAAGDDVPNDSRGDSPRTAPSTEPDLMPVLAAAPLATESESPASYGSGAADPQIDTSYYGMTDVGLVREHNEDNFLVADVAEARRGLEDLEAGATHVSSQVHGRGAIFAVCDGMGGAAAGEVASQMAVDTVYEFFVHLKQPKDRDHFARRIVASVEEAGNRIFSAAKMDRSRRGMGTTATVAGLIDKVLFVGQVGDSRAYVLRNGALTQITKDQSLVNQLIEAGQLTEDEAEAFEHSNIILQALGTTEEVTVDLTFLELRRGDRLMMCSDGLSGLVHPDMMTEVLSDTPSLSEACAKLIEMANVGGGHDNITVVCTDFAGDGLAEPTGDDDVLYQQYPLPTGLPDDRESLPLREPRMKTGGPKPGADVKREPSGAQEVLQSAAASSPSGSRLTAFLMVVALLILVLLAAATLAFFVSRSTEPAPDDVSLEMSGTAEEQVPLPETVGVSIDTDIEGELWIDGELFGPMSPDEHLIVRLEPGAYRIEARHEGAVLASEVLTVELGVTPTVTLRMPVGTDGSEALDDVPTEQPPEDPAPSEAEPSAPSPAADEPERDAQEPDLDPEREERRRRVREARDRDRIRQQGQTPAEDLPDNPFD